MNGRHVRFIGTLPTLSYIAVYNYKFQCWISHLHDIKKHGCMELHDNQVLTKAAGRARMRKLQKVHGSKCTCMVFSVSVLSHASVTPDFMHDKLLHARNGLKSHDYYT